MNEPVEERFWAKVDKNGPTVTHVEGLGPCWVWTANTDTFGYGYIGFQGRSIGTHRLSWILEHGDIPNNLCVLHKCDTPRCVRPEHLWLGTRGDNNKDRAAKKRGRNGGDLKAQATHCRKGHPWSEENTYYSPKRPDVRVCRICRDAWTAKQHAAGLTSQQRGTCTRQVRKAAGLPQTDRICIEEGCEEGEVSKGWCWAHYNRWRRYGDPQVIPPHGYIQKKKDK